MSDQWTNTDPRLYAEGIMSPDEVRAEEGHPDGLAIRWVDAEMQAVTLKPGDTLVLMHPYRLRDEQAIVQLREFMQTAFPGHKVVVLEEGMRLGVLTTGVAAAAEQG